MTRQPRLWTITCRRFSQLLATLGLIISMQFSGLLFAQEAKPAEVKPAEAKPAEAKPAEAKPAEAKPSEAKPADQKPNQPLPGHSSHGEVFNTGPRQAAYLMRGMPRIKFPTTCQNPDVQKFVEQGVGQLHGFWYLEAERSFRQAAAIEPDCAIAYWGMAFANFDNGNRAKNFLAEAVKRKDKSSDRERMYIEALDAFFQAPADKNRERHEKFTRAMEKIIYKYPDDTEAKALLVLRLWRNRDAGIPIASYLAIDALLNEIFAVEPMHPAHHYRIHLWDDEKSENALKSAALCGQTSPGVAHMWHMSGHIFARLRRYDDAAWQQEASARVDHAHMIRDRLLPDQIHNFAHNNEWLIRDFVHIGRMQAAIDLAKNMCELPRHPQFNNVTNRGSSFYGRLRLFEVLSTYEQWDQLIALAETMYLEPTDNVNEQLKRLRHLSAAHFRKGDVERGKQIVTQLRDRLNTEKMAQDKAGDEAEMKAKGENKPQPEIDKAKAEARKGWDGKVRDLENSLAEAEGHQALASGDAKAALPLLRKAGGIDNGYLALVQFLAGEKEEAEKAARQHAEQRKFEVPPLAQLIDILWRAEKKKEAGEAFEKLREISGSIDDLSNPLLARLTPIAMQLGLPTDWRVVKPAKSDVGDRPALDSLGPFRWSPSRAPDGTALDSQGTAHPMTEYYGRPTVLIFYLGSGCLHCAEQLQKFGPKAKDFTDAGITLAAISTDDVPGLKQSIENYKAGPLPFDLRSNQDLSLFKAFRCYDDFEKKTLHGTFILDAQGLIRWHDIGHEPFQDPDFVLKEAKRLLSLTPTPAGKLSAAN
ncbi:MAG: redoxin domain-containing protein [Planctomycetota bacterium]